MTMLRMNETRTPWTRLEGTPLWHMARREHDRDPRRKFHVWAHPLRLYWHAANTFHLPYDPDLDEAILTHDVIYDEHPFKERRSADWLIAHSGHDSHRGVEQIMKTEHHAITDDNRMVKLDLADFAFPSTVGPNRDLIEEESMALYRINARAFRAANIDFVEGMLGRITQDAVAGLVDPSERDIFRKIRAGMKETIRISRSLGL